jgi:uracil-DNA glycosylase family 4
VQSEYELLAHGIRHCSACSFRNLKIEPLRPSLTSPPVSIMFIGENPSWAKGQDTPFAASTPSGQALDENYLKPLELSRGEVWITDMFKCRYPKRVYDTKAQHGKEIQKAAETCSRLWLLREIELAKPKVIVTLADKEVYQRLRRAFDLPTPRAFAVAVGKPHEVTLGGHAVTLFPMIHPDISRPWGEGNKRKSNAREKWAIVHQQMHIPALKEVLKLK